ncbi:MAG: hypothetical protein RIQ71_865 [Verrucomicrobiota bacterium]|jgi:hypothetical protein
MSASVVAGLLLEALLLAQLFVGILCLRFQPIARPEGASRYQNIPEPPISLFHLFALAILNFLIPTLLLAMSKDMLVILEPILKNIRLTGIDNISALKWAVWFNSLFVASIISVTGGTVRSPFTSLLLTLPVLGLFIQGDIGLLLTNTVVCIIVYTFATPDHGFSLRIAGSFTSWLMNIFSLGIASFLAFVSYRP